MKTKPIFVICLLVLFAFSCDDHTIPKPRAYFRIDLPLKNYRTFDNSFPYMFDFPEYAQVVPNTSDYAEPWWANVVFPSFKATLHLSYKPIHQNLKTYLEDTHVMISKLIPKATGIREDMISINEHKVYGMIYHIQGTGVASPCQFYVTDSIRHFLRGALYFNVTPNNDSLAPVIDFLREDIQALVLSLEWK